MGLVDYPSSPESSDGNEDLNSSLPPAPSHNINQDNDEDDSRPIKKRKTSPSLTTTKSSPATTSLPALPATFRDLYSSTVRTTVQDNPALHAGRQRATPHIVGNWPAHISLEWYPTSSALALLHSLEKSAFQQTTNPSSSHQMPTVHSLLQDPLAVPLPLHISLSRPLILKTADKDTFSSGLATSLTSLDLQAFKVTPREVIWHPNEDGTRWFLVLRVASSGSPSSGESELEMLLGACNHLARKFGQPLLYVNGVQGREAARGGEAEEVGKDEVVEEDHFHISIAWALEPPPSSSGVVNAPQAGNGDDVKGRVVLIPESLRAELKKLEIAFDQVKLRIGQDVTNFPLRKVRMQTHGGKDDDEEDDS